MTSGCLVQLLLLGAATSRGLSWASHTHPVDLVSKVIRFPHRKQAVGRGNFLCIPVITLKRECAPQFAKNCFFTAHIFLHCSAVVGLSSQTLRRETGAFSGSVNSMTPSLVCLPSPRKTQHSIRCFSFQAGQTDACALLDPRTMGKPENS